MNDIESFRTYLLEKLISKAGKSYSKKQASDIISRLRLVEGILGRRFTKSNILDEDAFWKLVTVIKEARKIQGGRPAYHLYNNHVSALRRYRSYLKCSEQQHPPKKTTQRAD